MFILRVRTVFSRSFKFHEQQISISESHSHNKMIRSLAYEIFWSFRFLLLDLLPYVEFFLFRSRKEFIRLVLHLSTSVTFRAAKFVLACSLAEPMQGVHTTGAVFLQCTTKKELRSDANVTVGDDDIE